MTTLDIVASIDAEIAKLRKAKQALVGGGENIPSLNKKLKGRRKPLSAEARAKIAAAQRKRWAKQKKAAK
jgi:hypothetical protein